MSEQVGDASKELRRLTVRVGLPPSDELPTAVYANYASVHHTSHEVLITFAQVIPPSESTEVESMGPEAAIMARPVVRVAIAHTLLDGLVGALAARKEMIRQERQAEENEEVAEEEDADGLRQD
jgi:hypothetical protein